MPIPEDEPPEGELFSFQDIGALMGALVSRKRIERIELSGRHVWVKRFGMDKKPVWNHFQKLFAKIVGMPALNPSRVSSAKQMVGREVSRMEAFRAKGMLVPQILCRTDCAIVLGDAGTTVQVALKQARNFDVDRHEELLILSARELGRVHTTGLCHGRPHPRDFALRGDRIVFLDFEEAPELVMPLPVAQARDLWILFLQITSRACRRTETIDAAYNAWVRQAPDAAVLELENMTMKLVRFLPIARALYRLRPSRDVANFVSAAEYFSARQNSGRRAGLRVGHAAELDKV